MTLQNKEIAVIGTGISGLRTAHLLVKYSKGNIKKITLFEKSSSIGGVLKNTQQNSYLLEHGAQGVLLSRASFWKCLNEMQITNQILLPAQNAGTRYLLTPHSCVPITPNFFKLRKYGLIRIRDTLRFFAEIFIKKPKVIDINETLYSFFARHFGKKFTDTFLISLTFGIWGGGAKKLLVRYVFPSLIKLENGYGSLLKGFFITTIKNKISKQHNSKKTPKGLGSFTNGMEYLVQSLFNDICSESKLKNIEIELLLNTQVLAFTKTPEKISIEYSKDILKFQNNFDSVVYSGQPWRDETLAFNIDQINQTEINNSVNILRSIESHSIAVVGLGTKENFAQAPNGFGALAGQWSSDILGVLFVHSTYPAHAPKNSSLFRVLLGGDRTISIMEKDDTELIQIAKDRLSETKIQASHTHYDFEHVIKWENYIPLATTKQDNVLEAIWKIEALMSGLFFTGNYIKGPAISDCLDQAEIVHKNVLTFLAAKKNSL